MRALALISLMLLSGCATLTADQCKVADWRALGVEDGALGYGENRFLEYVKDCSNAGVTPDRAAWTTGRAEGLRRFCTPQGAYAAGVDGRPFRGQCSPETPEQLAALEKGETYRAITIEIEDLQFQIYQLEQEARDLYRDSRRHNGGFVFAGVRSGAYFHEISRLRLRIAELREQRAAYLF